MIKKIKELINTEHKYGDIEVLFFKDKETNDIIASCGELAICTYGDNIDMAQKHFIEAFELWKETVENTISIRGIRRT